MSFGWRFSATRMAIRSRSWPSTGELAACDEETLLEVGRVRASRVDHGFQRCSDNVGAAAVVGRSSLEDMDGAGVGAEVDAFDADGIAGATAFTEGDDDHLIDAEVDVGPAAEAAAGADQGPGVDPGSRVTNDDSRGVLQIAVE